MNNDENNQQGQLYLLGSRGYSAYEIAVQQGFVGTEDEWLASLVGPQGEPGTPFGDLTEEQKEELRGPQGKSAYEVSVDNGYVGTESEWVNSFLSPDGYYNKDAVDEKLNVKPFYFNSVAEMKELDLKENSFVVTAGYYEVNDGGGALYKIVEEESETEYQEELENGLYATLIPQMEINPIQLGAYGDETHDDSLAFQECILIAQTKGINLNGLDKSYLVGDTVTLPVEMSNSSEKGLYINNGLTLKNCKFKLKNESADLTSVLNIDVPTNETVIIENVHINGNKANQTSSLGTQNGGLHGIRAGFSEATPGVLIIKDSVIENCYTDCIDIRPREFKYFTIENCYIKGAGRNGITDNSINSIVKDCIFVDNGTRVAPESGYHIEPDSSKNLGIKKLIGCNFYNSGINDIAIYFNSNTFNMDNFTIDNCSTTGKITISGVCANESIVKNINITNSAIGGITRITKESDSTLLRYDNINIINSVFSRYLNIAGNTDATVKTNVIFDDSYIKADIRLNYNFNNVKIINSIFEKDEAPDSDWTEVFCINPCFPKIDDEADPYIINSLIIDNNQVTLFRRLLSNISSDTASPKNITNLQVTNNKMYFGAGVIILNEGEITNGVVMDNISYINSVGTLKKYQMGTSTNLIFKNNIGNFESSKALSNTSTAVISADNIWNSTVQS